jgi:hypothetical protein
MKYRAKFTGIIILDAKDEETARDLARTKVQTMIKEAHEKSYPNVGLFFESIQGILEF